MSTYEELQLIVSVAMLIVAILNYNYTHKNSRSDPEKVNGYFYEIVQFRRGG